MAKKLVAAALTDGQREILLVSDNGKGIRFPEDQVRPMGRTAAGVRGIKQPKGGRLISLLILNDGEILTISELGYGKRTAIDDYPLRGRGGQGVFAQRITDKTGSLVTAIQVVADDEVMLITETGNLIRTAVGDISTLGRNTQGVRIIRITDGDRLVGVDRIEPEAEEDEA